MRAHGLDSGRRVCGGGDHFHVAFAVDESLQPGEQDLVIVGEHDADHLLTSSPIGTVIRTHVPRSGRDSISKLPPTSATRSAIPNRPTLWLGRPCASPTAKPAPSSVNDSSSEPPVVLRRISTRVRSEER